MTFDPVSGNFTGAAWGGPTVNGWLALSDCNGAAKCIVQADDTGATSSISVAITAPASGATVQGTVPVSATASSNAGAITGVQFWLDGTVNIGLATAPTGGLYTISWNSTLTTDGPHTLMASAGDAAGHIGFSAPVSVIVKNGGGCTTPPCSYVTVAITAPADGATVPKGTVNIAATASTNAPGASISNVQFYVDGALIGTKTTAPYTIAWDTSALTSGSSHTITAKATDSQNNLGVSPPVQVTIGGGGPGHVQVAITAPANNATVSGLVNIAATASSDSGSITNVQFQVDGANLSSVSAPPYTVAWNTASLTAGSIHAIKVTATDSAGNTASASINVTIGGGTGGHVTVNLTAPANGAQVSGLVNIAATASSDAGTITNVEFYVDGASLSSKATTPYTASWNTILINDGQHTLTAQATDSAGNTNISTPVTVTVKNCSGCTGTVTVTITAPADGATVAQGTVTIAATASTNSGSISNVQFYVDGAIVGTKTTAPYTIAWNTLSLTPGSSHDLVARGTDSAGNTGVSPKVTVTIQNGGGGVTVTITAPGNGATVPQGLVTIAATASSLNGAITSVQFFADGTSIGTKTTAPYTATWNTGGLTAGSQHVLTAQAIDSSGSTGISQPVNVTISGGGGTLTVNITAPADGAQVSGIVNIAATAVSTAGSVTGVTFFVDGVSIGTKTTPAYTMAWNTTGLAAGSQHVITAQATDSAGNTAAATPIGVTIAGCPTCTGHITVSITAPANNAVVSQGMVTVAATASTDAGAITKVEFYRDGVLLTTDATSPYTAVWNTSGLSTGSTHTLWAIAYDSAGDTKNSSVVSVTIGGAVSTVTVAVTAPGNGATVSGVVNIAAIASTNIGSITGVTFLVDGTSIGTKTTAPYAVAWNTTGLAAGSQHVLTAQATDSSGSNGASQPVTVTIAGCPSCSGHLTVNMTAPADGATVAQGSVPLAATASTDAGSVTSVEFYADGTRVGTDPVAPYTAPWNTISLAPGSSHYLWAVGHDSAGDVASSRVITVSVAGGNSGVIVTITSPAWNATVNGLVDIAATASTNSGTITYVQFMVDGAFVGPESTHAPYATSWNTAGWSGTHTITAIAYDSAGDSGTSAPIQVNVANGVGVPVVSNVHLKLVYDLTGFTADSSPWCTDPYLEVTWDFQDGALTVPSTAYVHFFSTDGGKKFDDISPNPLTYALHDPISHSIAGDVSSPFRLTPGQTYSVSVRATDASAAGNSPDATATEAITMANHYYPLIDFSWVVAAPVAPATTPYTYTMDASPPISIDRTTVDGTYPVPSWNWNWSFGSTTMVATTTFPTGASTPVTLTVTDPGMGTDICAVQKSVSGSGGGGVKLRHWIEH